MRYVGRAKLVSKGELNPEDAAKWEAIDRKLISLHQDTQELLWYSRRRLSREYASSEQGLGKHPKNPEGEEME